MWSNPWKTIKRQKEIIREKEEEIAELKKQAESTRIFLNSDRTAKEVLRLREENEMLRHRIKVERELGISFTTARHLGMAAAPQKKLQGGLESSSYNNPEESMSCCKR